MAMESFKVWRDSLVVSKRSVNPAKGRSSTVFWTSLGNPDSCSQDALEIMTVVETEWAAASAVSMESCNGVLARS